MASNFFSRINSCFCIAMLLVVAGATAASVVSAQEASSALSGTIAEEPIVVGYARNISPVRVIEYVKSLTERLNIGKSFQEEMSSERQQKQIEEMGPKVKEPLYGVAMYMVTGLIPSFESVSFQQVVDEEDAIRLVKGRKNQWGDNGHLAELGNGCFKVEYRNVSSFPLPEGVDEKQYENNNPSINRGYQFTQKVVEKDGKKFVEHKQVITSLFRYHDSMLYEANFEDLFKMSLPMADAISSSVNGSTDLGFHAYLDRVPPGIHQLGWSMLSAAAGSQMQQGDEESDSSYEMRRSGGELGLSLIQSVLFDVDSSDGWAKFATSDEGSLRGELRVRPRNNSKLTKQLQDAAGVSRFAAILSDNAAGTFHLCVRLPEEGPVALQATGKWLTETMGRDFSNDPAMVSAAESFAGVLGGLAEHRNLEMLLKVGWTEASGGVVYGGLQVIDDPELLKNLHHLLTHLPNSPPGIEQFLTLEESNGMQVIVVRPPEDGIEELRSATGANITHVYLAHQNSCLWFAAGTEKAVEIIRESAARCSEGAGATRTPLLSGRIDMERWLSYPQDDPAQIASMPHWLDENAWWFPPSPFTMAVNLANSPEKPEPIMQRVFDLGGSQQAQVTLEADESGILLQASLGEALGNHIIARMIASQEQMMAQSRKMMEEQQKAAEEAAKKQLPPEPVPK